MAALDLVNRERHMRDLMFPIEVEVFVRHRKRARVEHAHNAGPNSSVLQCVKGFDRERPRSVAASGLSPQVVNGFRSVDRQANISWRVFEKRNPVIRQKYTV